jgi:tripartite-type tricarboxylate transporter receptor subunit TctC
MAPTRHPEFPDIPTVAEVLPSFAMPTWYGLFATAGTPAPIVARLNTAINAILAKPAITAQLLRVGNQVQPESVEVANARLRDGYALYGRVVKDMGIKDE